MEEYDKNPQQGGGGNVGVVNTFNVSMFYWIRLAHEIENIIDMTKKALILYCYVNYLIYNYLPCDLQSTLSCIINKMAFSFT